MSQSPISLSDDLKALRDEGYDIEIKAGYLLMKGVPYVNSEARVMVGTLVSTLDLAGEMTTVPSTHVMYFAGDHPCRFDGSEINGIKHASQHQILAECIEVNHSFSSRPSEGYRDYHHKMTTYVAIISSQAEAIDPAATAKTFPAIEALESESVFCYTDTASSRAGIAQINRKLEQDKIAIVGLGGTGSYILDLLAKTPVREIHLFDGDSLLQHNAFRAPGAVPLEILKIKPLKVRYLKDLYSQMHRGIVAHESFVDETNQNQLVGMDFVFLCMDNGKIKRALVELLETHGITFIDVGMGLYQVDDQIGGTLRVTTSDNRQRDHIREKKRIPFGEGDENAAYSTNIQVADLNALNATLAVIKWKKLLGFYQDFDFEYNAMYVIDGNTLINEDNA